MTAQTRAGVAKRRIILHCGAPKTGSTSLQHFFADNTASLEAGGVVCPPRFLRQGNVDPLHAIFTQLRAGRRAEEKLLAAGRQRLDQLFDNATINTVLISNESAIGEPFMASEPGFFPIHGRGIELLRKLFAGYDVKVVYFIRAFESFLPSYYVQYVRLGGSLSFKDYCAHIGDENLSWIPVVRCLENAFGANNVNVCCSSVLQQDPGGTVASTFGRYVPSLPEFDATLYRHNPAVGPWVLALYRMANRAFAACVPRRSHKTLRPLMRRWMFEPVAYAANLMRFADTKASTRRLSNLQVAQWHTKYQNDIAKLGLN